MKRFTIIFCGIITTTTCAMQNQQWPRPIEIIRPMIISFLTNNKPLSSNEVLQVEKLIKEIRVQSPAKGLECQEKLNTRLTNDSLNIEGFKPTRLHSTMSQPFNRAFSPLAMYVKN